MRAVIEAIVAMHVDEPHMHHLLYDSAPRSEALQKRLREADAAMAEEVAWHLERLGVAGEHRLLVANLLVAGVEAQAHTATIDTASAVDPTILVDLLTQLWWRALQDQ